MDFSDHPLWWEKPCNLTMAHQPWLQLFNSITIARTINSMDMYGLLVDYDQSEKHGHPSQAGNSTNGWHDDHPVARRSPSPHVTYDHGPMAPWHMLVVWCCMMLWNSVELMLQLSHTSICRYAISWILRIANLKWKLIFQARWLAGSMLVYQRVILMIMPTSMSVVGKLIRSSNSFSPWKSREYREYMDTTWYDRLAP